MVVKIEVMQIQEIGPYRNIFICVMIKVIWKASKQTLKVHEYLLQSDTDQLESA